MKLRLDKPWTELTAENVARLPGQLGVYQIADADGTIVHIGYAGGRSRLGLRSELQGELEARGAGYKFRVEVNMQYTSRYLELLMLPVWVLAVRYAADRPPVRLVLNGQTGRIHGRAPKSWTKIAGIVLVVLAAIGAYFLVGGIR